MFEARLTLGAKVVFEDDRVKEDPTFADYFKEEQLGHASIQITVDVYGRWIPSSDRSSADRLDAIAPPAVAEPHPSAPPTHPNRPGYDRGPKEGPLTTRPERENEWRRVDSNHRPKDYETFALAT